MEQDSCFPIAFEGEEKAKPTGHATGAAGSTAHCGHPPIAPRPAWALPREQCSCELHHREFNLTEEKQTSKKLMEIIGFYSLPLAKRAVARHQCEEPPRGIAGGGLARQQI